MFQPSFHLSLSLSLSLSSFFQLSKHYSTNLNFITARAPRCPSFDPPIPLENLTFISPSSTRLAAQPHETLSVPAITLVVSQLLHGCYMEEAKKTNRTWENSLGNIPRGVCVRHTRVRQFAQTQRCSRKRLNSFDSETASVESLCDEISGEMFGSAMN